MHEPPFIAGVGGGVGTTTVAAALRGRDCGLYQAGKPVQVLVCRSTMHSLGCAQRALAHAPQPPVLAVVDDVPNAHITPNTAHRMRMTEGTAAVIVRLPFVSDWRDVESPHQEARALLVDPELPKGLRVYAGAVRDLVGEIVGLLQPPAAPASNGRTTSLSAFAGR